MHFTLSSVYVDSRVCSFLVNIGLEFWSARGLGAVIIEERFVLNSLIFPFFFFFFISCFPASPPPLKRGAVLNFSPSAEFPDLGNVFLFFSVSPVFFFKKKEEN